MKIAVFRQQKSPKHRTFSVTDLNCSIFMGWEMGFEPTIFGTTIRRFNQLSYTHHILFCLRANPLHGHRAGAPCWIRTSGLLLRRQLLYPAELKAHKFLNGAMLACDIRGNDLRSVHSASFANGCANCTRPPGNGAGDGNRTHVFSLEG